MDNGLIFRQAVIDVLKQFKPEIIPYEKARIYVEETVETMYDRIVELPSVQPEPQWIPVERELPEDYTDVLVWFEYFRYGDYNCLYRTHGIGTYAAEYNSWMINH